MTDQVNLNDYDIPEEYEFRGYTYDLWKATTEEWYARSEEIGRASWRERV